MSSAEAVERTSRRDGELGDSNRETGHSGEPAPGVTRNDSERVLVNNPDCSSLRPWQHCLQWRWSSVTLDLEHRGAACLSAPIAGRVTIRTGEQELALADDSVVYLPEGSAHRISARPLTPICAFTVLFRHGFLDQVHASLLEQGRCALAPGCDSSRVLRSPRAASLLRRLHFELLSTPLEQPTLERRIEEVASAFLESLAPAGASARRESTRRDLSLRIERARKFIEDHLGERLRLTDLAREACLSPFHFHRSFRALVGDTPRQYVVRRRLLRARSLLRSTDWPARRVAIETGFASVSALASALRRESGDLARDLLRR